MSFTLKLAARTLPNGKVIPAKEKTFDRADQLERWFFQNSNKRKRRNRNKKNNDKQKSE